MFWALLLAAAAPQMADAEAEVRAADAQFWQAFNACDAKAMATLVAPDIEFYHDKTGLTAKRGPVVDSLMKGPCGTPGLHVRRQAVVDSVAYDPVPGYGAILTGRHRFYAKTADKPERLDGEARFAVVWQSDHGQWQMKRILSYSHRPAQD